MQCLHPLSSLSTSNVVQHGRLFAANLFEPVQCSLAFKEPFASIPMLESSLSAFVQDYVARIDTDDFSLLDCEFWFIAAIGDDADIALVYNDLGVVNAEEVNYICFLDVDSHTPIFLHRIATIEQASDLFKNALFGSIFVHADILNPLAVYRARAAEGPFEGFDLVEFIIAGPKSSLLLCTTNGHRRELFECLFDLAVRKGDIL